MMNVLLLLLGCTAGGEKSSCDDGSNERLATSKTSSRRCPINEASRWAGRKQLSLMLSQKLSLSAL